MHDSAVTSDCTALGGCHMKFIITRTKAKQLGTVGKLNAKTVVLADYETLKLEMQFMFYIGTARQCSP